MDATIAKFRISGLCAAPFTPFTAEGGLDLAAVAFHVEELLRQGVHYAFVNGTTGEGYLCSLAERKALVEAWIAASAGRVAVIAMVACENAGETAELAAHAAAAGAAAISVQPPTFFKPGGPADILPQLRVAAAAAPALPLYYYHIAIKTGVNIRCDQLLDAVHAAQAAGELRSFRGIKYSDADLHILANCIAAHGGAFDIAYGKDEQALGALAMGAKGFVGSTYNYSGRVTNAVIAAFNAGDLAGALAAQRKAQALVNLLYASGSYGPGGCNVGKAIMELLLRASAAKAGNAAGRTSFCGPARWPNPTVSEAGLAKLQADLTALGFFGW